MALVALLSYPIGIFPALASGFGYYTSRQQAPCRRACTVSFAALGGAATMAIEQALFLHSGSYWLLLVAGVSAAILASYASRSHSRAAA
jgi:hypothetical protein